MNTVNSLSSCGLISVDLGRIMIAVGIYHVSSIYAVSLALSSMLIINQAQGE